MKKHAATPSAFTLLELLVVIAIISVVAGLLFASLSRARAAGDAITCVQNLRVVAAANIRYASDHDSRYCFAQARSNNLRWHGERHDSKAPFDPTRGPLSPYLGREAKVKRCPSFADFLKGEDSFETGCGGYGYNAIYIGGTPANKWDGEITSAIPAPSRTVMFTDTALSRKTGVQEYAYTEPWEWVSPTGKLSGELIPSVHFRHSGKANVAWCDGHVTPEAPSKFGHTSNYYGGDDEKHHIGWFGPSEDNGYWNPLSNPTN